VSLMGGLASSISGISCGTNNGNWRCSFTIRPLDLGTDPTNWGQCTDAGGTQYRYCIVSPMLSVRGSMSTDAGLTLSEIPNASDVVSNRIPISAASLSGSLSSTGAGTLTYMATYGYVRYSNSSFTRSIRFDIPPVIASNVSTSTDVTAGWFVQQQWYRQTYYAISSGYSPGGSANCVVGATCLTVANLPSPYTTINNKGAILIFMGRSLNGTARPSSTLTDYLEGENGTPADNSFVHFRTANTAIGGANTLTNDRVVVLAP